MAFVLQKHGERRAIAGQKVSPRPLHQRGVIVRHDADTTGPKAWPPSVTRAWGARCLQLWRSCAVRARRARRHEVDDVRVDACTVRWHKASVGRDGGTAMRLPRHHTATQLTERAQQRNTLARSDPLGCANKPPSKLVRALYVEASSPRTLDPRLRGGTDNSETHATPRAQCGRRLTWIIGTCGTNPPPPKSTSLVAQQPFAPYSSHTTVKPAMATVTVAAPTCTPGAS